MVEVPLYAGVSKVYVKVLVMSLRVCIYLELGLCIFIKHGTFYMIWQPPET